MPRILALGRAYGLQKMAELPAEAERAATCVMQRIRLMRRVCRAHELRLTAAICFFQATLHAQRIRPQTTTVAASDGF